jgi:hypothetical protein
VARLLHIVDGEKDNSVAGNEKQHAATQPSRLCIVKPAINAVVIFVLAACAAARLGHSVAATISLVSEHYVITAKTINIAVAAWVAAEQPMAAAKATTTK